MHSRKDGLTIDEVIAKLQDAAKTVGGDHMVIVGNEQVRSVKITFERGAVISTRK